MRFAAYSKTARQGARSWNSYDSRYRHGRRGGRALGFPPRHQKARDHGAEELDRFRRRYDIVDQVKPIPGETVFKKVSPSAFWGTPLVGHLNFLGVDTIITCGESTSGCVRASVVDGTTNRLRMVVAEECVFDRHEACHAINLFDMNQKYADVLPLDDIVKYLDAWRAEKAGQVGYANNSIEYLKDLAIGEDYKGLR